MAGFNSFLISSILLLATAHATHHVPVDYDEEAALAAAIKASLADVKPVNASKAAQIPFRFGAEGVHPMSPFDVSGFSGIEQSHRWTEGDQKEASITIPRFHGPNRDRVTSVTFENIGVLRPQTVLVCVNNLLVKSLRFAAPSLNETIAISFSAHVTGPARVTFKTPGACRPGEINPTNLDTRVLGVRLSTMFLTVAECPLESRPVRFRFGAEGAGINYEFPVTGLAAIEQAHRWTEGPQKEASFTLPQTYGPKRVTCAIFENVIAFIPTTIDVLLNQELITSVTFRHDSMRQSFEIPFPDDLNGPAVVTLKTPDACLPGNGDPRILGVALSTLLLTFDDHAGVAAPRTSPEDEKKDAQLTSGQLGEITTVFNEIMADHNEYISVVQSICFTALNHIKYVSRADLESLRKYYDISKMQTIMLADEGIVSKYFHLAWLIDTYSAEQARTYYRHNPAYIAFINKNENLIKQETAARKERLEALAQIKYGFESWLQYRHYKTLASIVAGAPGLDLEMLKGAAPGLFFGPLNDEAVTKLYFEIASTLQRGGLVIALSNYRQNMVVYNFIKTYHVQITSETQKRMARLAALSNGSIPSEKDRNYVIQMFLQKYPQYNRAQAEFIYDKFINL